MALDGGSADRDWKARSRLTDGRRRRLEDGPSRPRRAAPFRHQVPGRPPQPLPHDGADRIAPERLLETLRPDLSAATPLWPWQKRALVVAVIGVVLAAVMAPRLTGLLVALVLALPFFAVFFIRMLAVTHVLVTALFKRARPASSPRYLPTYAVLVPLYDEAAIIPGLVAALDALHYPRSKLAIRFIVEEHDSKTRAALDALRLLPHMDIVEAPDGQPRTKPRALDIALACTPGELVVVYDAEDQPEPDQLLKAASAFEAAPPAVVCLQARLNTFNPTESLLARQFTLEYTALFDVMLPALERFGLPVPLGGTSNHFRGILAQTHHI